MSPKICTAAIIVAMEEEAEVLHAAHHPEEVDTMEANLKQEVTIKCRMVPNQHAGSWYRNIYGHRQEDCRKRIRENAPCRGLNGSTYWPKQKASPVGEVEDHQETQGAVGEMYTGHLATVFSGFQ